MLKTGDDVFVTFHGRTAEGTVLLASPNGLSLVLQIDAAYRLGDGLMFGPLPIFLDTADNTYRCLFDNEPIAITRRSDHR